MGLFDFFKKKSSSDALLDERRRIVTELKEAEKNFLTHKIDKPTFDSISRERNSDLIRIAAEIDSHKHKTLSKSELDVARSVSADKRKIISSLLAEKQKKVYELKLAESGYLKRRISEDAYSKISSEVKKEIIAIDSQIKSILESEKVSHLKECLKQGAAEISKQQKLSDSRKSQDYEQEMEEEIFEQSKDVEENLEFGDNENGAEDKEIIGDEPEQKPKEKVWEEEQNAPDERNIPRRLRRR